MEHALAQDDFTFEPLLPLDEMSDEAVHAEATSLYGKVRASHVSHIEQLTSSRFSADVSGIDDDILNSFGEQLKKNWRKKHYVDIVREVVSLNASASIERPAVPILSDSSAVQDSHRPALLVRTCRLQMPRMQFLFQVLPRRLFSHRQRNVREQGTHLTQRLVQSFVS